MGIKIMQNCLTKDPNSNLTRDIRYDMLRITAAFFVVMIHVAAQKWYVISYDSSDWAAMNLYDSFVSCAVPLFFMLSGAFMLKKEIDIKKLYSKIISLLAIYFIWSTLYAIDTIGLSELRNVDFKSFITLTLQSKFHLWFIPTLIGLYILHPILVAIVRYEKGKYTPYILMVFLCFGVIIPTILAFFNTNYIISTVLGKITVELTSYSGYMILGYYLANIKEIKIKPTLCLLIYICIALISAKIVHLDALNKKAVSIILYGNFSISIFLESILIFLLFQNIPKENFTTTKLSSLIQKLSSLTMGVYLFHPFVLDHLDLTININVLSFSPILSIPIIGFITITISFFVSLIMTRIPVVRFFWKI